MKNKFLTAFIAIVLMACISTGFLACRKSTSVSNESQAIGTVQKVAESILEDSLFTNLILDFMNESIILNENKNFYEYKIDDFIFINLNGIEKLKSKLELGI